jgi:uncharacterized membrane protein
MRARTKDILRWPLTALFVGSGVMHFAAADVYIAMMPEALPWHRALVYVSGVCEILGGLGLVLPATRRLAAWGLVALLVAIFPANLNMAVNDIPLGDLETPTWALWTRLPLQLVFILWAWWYTRPDPPR